MASATLRSLALQALLSDGLRDARRGWHRLWRGARRRLHYAHQVDDPYSILLAQVLPRLVDAAGLELLIHVIPAPGPAYAPDAERLAGWALLDAGRLAAQHGLDWPAAARRPDPDAVTAAAAAALAERPWREQLAVLVALGLELLAGREPTGDGARVARSEVAERLAREERWLHRAGHYQGAMLAYEGEWFWGLDRLPLLEERLRGEGLELAPSLDPGALPVPEPVAPGAPLELFFSFRSPYSYLALDRSAALAERHGVELVIHPVLPMVMRGLAVPFAKRLYIVRDCRRLAQAHGIPFGRIADPLGVGVERCMAVAALARDRGCLLAWLSSAARGIWAEGIDVAGDAGLAALAERAGLEPGAALAAAAELGEQAPWRRWAEQNREALLALGLWGVPSYRLGGIIAWGQDRLPLLERSLAARTG